MKLVILVAAVLVAISVAAPPDSPQIIKSSFDQNPEGSYVFSYETEDGISRSETGELKEALDEENKPHTVVVVKGSYSYTDPDGNPVVITYVADETGYHAEGDTIPKAPTRR